MKLEDAKRFYFQYDGSSFHMDREEPAKFNSFKMLNLGEETLKAWDEAYLNRLLDEMEKMERLDTFNMTLVIENMAGRTESMNDGGVYTVCRLSGLAMRMNDIVERLIGACYARHDTDDRFEKAVRRYRSAYVRWGS